VNPRLFPDRTDYNACLGLSDSPRRSHANILGAQSAYASTVRTLCSAAAES